MGPFCKFGDLSSDSHFVGSGQTLHGSGGGQYSRFYAASFDLRFDANSLRIATIDGTSGITTHQTQTVDVAARFGVTSSVVFFTSGCKNFIFILHGANLSKSAKNILHGF